MVTKPARVENCVEGLLSYSHMAFCQVVLVRSRISLKFIFQLSQDLRPTKLGRVLTTVRRFSTQTIKCSPTSFSVFLLALLLDGLTRNIGKYFF